MLKIPANSRLMIFLMAAALALNATLIALALAGPGHGRSSGIQVKVVEQTNSAAETGGGPDTAGHRYEIVVRHPVSKKIITTVCPDEDGYYRIHLVPGRYLLEVRSVQQGVVLSSSMPAVEVQGGEFTDVTIRVERYGARHMDRLFDF